MSVVDKKVLAYVKTRGPLRATKLSLRMRFMKCCRKLKTSPAVLLAHLGCTSGRTDPNALWTFRGGGGLGVTTRLQLGLYPQREVYTGARLWSIEDRPEVVARWLAVCLASKLRPTRSASGTLLFTFVVADLSVPLQKLAQGPLLLGTTGGRTY